MNLGITFQLVDDVLDYGGKCRQARQERRRRFPRRQDHAAGGAGVPPRLATPNANSGGGRSSAARPTDGDLEHAIGLMTKHRALEDTIGRAHHYGAIARDALALFPDSEMKAALAETVDFCIARTH